MSQFKKISNNIQQLSINNPKTKHGLVWIDIKNPGKKEIEFLRKNYEFDLRYLQASSAKSVAQRPVLEQGKNFLFMILHFPIFKNNHITTGEIEFFIGHGFLITLHNDIDEIKKFFSVCKKDGNSLLTYNSESSAVLLYELLEKLILNCYNLLDQNSIKIDNVEEIIFGQRQKKAASQILNLRHNIINFRKIMQNHKNILQKLTEMESKIVPNKTIKNYYFSLIDHSKKIWQILENQKEMIEALYDTNESLLNYRISDIMKTLTIFSVIVFPLTLFAALFGMNTTKGMPFLEAENGFWLIIFIMLLACLGMMFYFKRKKWL